MKRILLVLALVAFALPAFAQQGVYQTKGKAIAGHSLDVVTIHYVFAFSCPHCHHFNGALKQLKAQFGDRIKIIGVPMPWGGEDPGRLYLLAEKNGKEAEVKEMLFDFIHEKGLGASLYQRDKLVFVAKLNGLLDVFQTQMDSPWVIEEAKKRLKLAEEMGIDSTPTLVVERSLVAAGNADNLALIINGLLKTPIDYKPITERH